MKKRAKKKKKKIGRPLRAKSASTAYVIVRLTPRERAEMEKRARAAGLSLSAYLREGALGRKGGR